MLQKIWVVREKPEKSNISEGIAFFRKIPTGKNLSMKFSPEIPGFPYKRQAHAVVIPQSVLASS